MIKVTDNRIGGGTKANDFIGWKRPNNDGISPDWDVKWPDGDGKEGWEGFDEAKGL